MKQVKIILMAPKVSVRSINTAATAQAVDDDGQWSEPTREQIYAHKSKVIDIYVKLLFVI